MAKGSIQREEVTELQSDVRSMAGSLKKLENQMSELHTDMKTLIQTINEHHTEKELLKKDLEVINSRIDSQQADIELIRNTEIKPLRKKVSAIEKKLSTNSTYTNIIWSGIVILVPILITFVLNKLL